MEQLTGRIKVPPISNHIDIANLTIDFRSSCLLICL